jgi:hypothetical protein
MASVARSASFARAPTRLVDGVVRRRAAAAGGSRVGPRRASAAAAERDPPSAPVSESLSRARRALLWRAEDAAAAERPLDVYTELLVSAVRDEVLASSSGGARASSEGAFATEPNADGFSGAELSAALDHLAFDALQDIMEQFEVSRGIEVMGTMRQVVIVGSPGFDSRAFRVPWPRGTCVFEFGGAEAHAAAAATLKAASAKPPRGCSHRRVPSDPFDVAHQPFAYGDLEERLMRAGYSPEVPSVWLFQDSGFGSHESGVDAERLSRWRDVCEEATELMCAGSRVVGHVPCFFSNPAGAFGEALPRELAACGVLAKCFRMTSLGFERDDAPKQPGVFVGTKRRPSAREAEYYREQVVLVETEHGDEEGFES